MMMMMANRINTNLPELFDLVNIKQGVSADQLIRGIVEASKWINSSYNNHEVVRNLISMINGEDYNANPISFNSTGKYVYAVVPGTHVTKMYTRNLRVIDIGDRNTTKESYLFTHDDLERLKQANLPYAIYNASSFDL